MRKVLGEDLKDWIVSIVIALLLAGSIRCFILELYKVEGSSMLPTLVNGERFVVNKFIYRFRSPAKGEIVVFRYPSDPNRDFIKRVIATAGDTVEIKNHRVLVNGRMLNEDYIMEETRSDYPLVTVPAGHIFVLGDNRNHSEDSRFPDVGFVSVELLEGKAVVVLWPFESIRTLP